MLSYRFVYNGAIYYTRNGSLGSAELDSLASSEYKNATSYVEIMTAGDGSLNDAWPKASGVPALNKLPSIDNAAVEVVDGLVKVAGTVSFNPIEVTADKVTLNGQIIWPVEEQASSATVTEEVKEEPQVETPVEEAPPVDRPLPTMPKQIKTGVLPGVNGQEYATGYGSFDIGIMVHPNDNPKRQKAVIGNCKFVVGTAEPVEEKPQPKPQPQPQTKASAAQPHQVVFSNKLKEKPPVQEETAEMVQEPTITIVDEKPAEAVDVQESVMEQAPTMDAEDAWTVAAKNMTVLEGEMDPIEPDETPITENDLGSAAPATYPDNSTEVPAFLLSVPRNLLGQLTSFETKDVMDDDITEELAQKNHWDKLGSWYAVDVITDNSRIFYNAETKEVLRATYIQCRDVFTRGARE